MIRLGDIGSAAIGLTYSPNAVADGGTLVLRSSNIQNEKLVFRDDVFVEMDVPLSSRVQPGDILICARNGSRPLIGKSVLLDHRVEGMAFGAFMALFRSKFNNYVIHQFRSNGMRRQIEMHLGATINQITNSSLLSFEIPFPSLEKERDLIAESLSDADAAIESLDALIAKKRDVKQAVMQQLLTCRTRLPGFTTDWKEVRLGDIALVVMGQSPQSIYYNTREDGIPLIQGNADIIDRKSIRRIWTSVSPKVAEPGDVLITVRAPVGYAAIASEQVCLGRGVCAIQPHTADSTFVFHSLVYWEPKWKKMEQGSTFTAANSKEVNDFTIYVPDSKKEQEAIAETLSAMDDELESLTEQVAKLRMVKEGMMQDLLTGKVRLV
jgi:type I restriction enzyme S subunit